MRRTIVVGVLLVLVGVTQAAAQSNEVIDALLEQQTAAFGPTLQLVLSAGGRVDDSASEAASLEVLRSLGWRLAGKELEDPVTAKELSYLIMKSLDLSGGIMYSIFPSPRYAFRELVYDRVISRQIPPDSRVSGQQVVRYLGTVLRMQGDS